MRCWKTAELLILNRANHEKLLEEIPAYERYHRIIIENAYVAMQQRVLDIIGESINDVRNLSHDILPMDVKREGVGQAFDLLKKQAESRYGEKFGNRLPAHKLLNT